MTLTTRCETCVYELGKEDKNNSFSSKIFPSTDKQYLKVVQTWHFYLKQGAQIWFLWRAAGNKQTKKKKVWSRLCRGAEYKGLPLHGICVKSLNRHPTNVQAIKRCRCSFHRLTCSLVWLFPVRGSCSADCLFRLQLHPKCCTSQFPAVTVDSWVSLLPQLLVNTGTPTCSLLQK